MALAELAWEMALERELHNNIMCLMKEQQKVKMDIKLITHIYQDHLVEVKVVQLLWEPPS